MRELNKYLDTSGRIIESRYENGDDGVNRYGMSGEKAILCGLLKSMQMDGRIGYGGHITCAVEMDWSTYDQDYWDNISGEWLHPDLVKEVRKEEMIEFKKHNVYTKVPIQECLDRTGSQPVGTRWVDINKGDKVHPEYRSRLVAQEIKVDKREDCLLPRLHWRRRRY